MAFLFGAAPLTAYAGGFECSCEHKCTEESVNTECDLCNYDYTLCEAREDTEDTEDIEESSEPAEEVEEDWGPLTPDGNMTLVDDYGAPSQSGKQFITVVTKSGNYFYIIIDRDDNGTETVHFLNMVDEADLLALMDEEAVDQYLASKDALETPAETVTPEQTESAEEPEEPAEEPEKEKKSSGGALVIVLILALGGAGGYLYFTKFKGKKPQKETVDPDADYTEEDDDYLDNLADEVDEILTDDEEAEDS